MNTVIEFRTRQQQIDLLLEELQLNDYGVNNHQHHECWSSYLAESQRLRRRLQSLGWRELRDT